MKCPKCGKKTEENCIETKIEKIICRCNKCEETFEISPSVKLIKEFNS